MTARSIVGEIRPSQIMWSYGPGAVIDLPNLSVITMGTEFWDENQCPPIGEARLLSAVRRRLGAQVDALRVPPRQWDSGTGPMAVQSNTGIPVTTFPRWLRCVRCGLLSDIRHGLFRIRRNYYRPEETRYVHTGCTGSKNDQKAKDADAVPSRFLLACRNGHLDDFPWHYFVHGGPSTCRGTLRFFEVGASLQTENLWVKCDECGASKSMARAFGNEGEANLPRCRGRHPHLGQYEPNCEQDPRTVLLGATNSWFPITLSALAIPLDLDPVSHVVRDNWQFFRKVNTEEGVELILDTQKIGGNQSEIHRYQVSDIWNAIKILRSGESRLDAPADDIKQPEWSVLTAPSPQERWPHFLSRPSGVPSGFENRVAAVRLVERLREVNALLGFTRVEAPEEVQDLEDPPAEAPICAGKPTWVPAGQVYGEGIFIQFDEAEVRRWEERDSVQQRSERLFAGHREWRAARQLPPEDCYPGARYVMLHTLAHLLIRELSLECGYGAASIRERVYASEEAGQAQAGVLVYTAAADSDGTLGGLVELGKPENLGRLLSQALERAKVCSSDPLCAEHDPGADRTLHAASCHACSFVSETSCERGNRYLDRALVVPTLDSVDIAFF